jgi:2',3'-cyclic-nucleotide 2'-phosphodiesterase (5'-nucleotidase family)
VILCSAGDFYGGADAFNEPKSHFVAKMMGYLGYDAIGLGEMDLNYGLAKLLEDRDAYGLNLTCANLVSKLEDGEPPEGRDRTPLQEDLNTVFPPYLVVERDGVRFGFVALLSPETKSRKVGAKSNEVEAMTYIIKDPWEMAGIVLAEARDECDILVLLAHMDRFDLEMNLPEYQEIDFVVMGHNSQTSRSIEPVMIGEVPCYMATSQGQTIGNLTITLDADLAVIDTNNKVHFLDERFEDDPAVAEMLDQFDEENKKTQKITYAKEQLKATSASGENVNVYLGAGACMTCHTAEFNSYVTTGHAGAYRTLSAQSVQRDAGCIGCHSTGYGERGGFPGIRRIGAQLDLIDVQCEACHGPGTEHNRDGSYVDIARESCVRCHTKEQDPDFDFAKDWEKIKH